MTFPALLVGAGATTTAGGGWLPAVGIGLTIVVAVRVSVHVLDALVAFVDERGRHRQT